VSRQGLSKFMTADDDIGGDHQNILFIQLPFSWAELTSAFAKSPR
jgi:hypothetical protein